MTSVSYLTALSQKVTSTPGVLPTSSLDQNQSLPGRQVDILFTTEHFVSNVWHYQQTLESGLNSSTADRQWGSPNGTAICISLYIPEFPLIENEKIVSRGGTWPVVYTSGVLFSFEKYSNSMEAERKNKNKTTNRKFYTKFLPQNMDLVTCNHFFSNHLMGGRWGEGRGGKERKRGAGEGRGGGKKDPMLRA